MQMKGRFPLYLLVLSMLAALFLPGCAAKELAALNADKQALESRVGDLENQLAEKQGLEDRVSELISNKQAMESRVAELEGQISGVAADATANSHVFGINALLAASGDASEPAAELAFSGSIAVTASAVIPDGMALSHWEINGKPAAAQDGKLTVDVTGNAVIEAVLREELKVAAVNAYLQLLDAKGNPTGDKMDSYVFENDVGKKISVYIGSVVPANHTIDHWRINGIPHHFNKTVTGIKVYDLHAAAVYEVVLKNTLAPSAKPAPTRNSTPAPTQNSTPDPTQSSTPAPTPTLAPTEPPVDTVSIACTNCTFSGGGYTNAKNGSVPKGTTITLTGTVDIGNPQYWEINGVTNSSYGKTFSYTVNGNTAFKYSGYN